MTVGLRKRSTIILPLGPLPGYSLNGDPLFTGRPHKFDEAGLYLFSLLMPVMTNAHRSLLGSTRADSDYAGRGDRDDPATMVNPYLCC